MKPEYIPPGAFPKEADDMKMPRFLPGFKRRKDVQEAKAKHDKWIKPVQDSDALARQVKKINEKDKDK